VFGTRTLFVEAPAGDSSMKPKPWYDKGLRFECTQCGACCKNHGDYAFVYLTEHDLREIPRFLGISRAEFVERYCTKDEDWVVLRMDEPACAFLDEANRCKIYPVRPKQCASWPFWTENLERSTWEGPVKDCCPGIGKGEVTPAAEVERIARETDEFYA
jgi:Fe-S-cluster containining protein